MNEKGYEKEEIVEVDNEKYTVITKIAKDVLSKDKLVKLICNYAIREINEENI